MPMIRHAILLRSCNVNYKSVASKRTNVLAASKNAVVIGGGIGGIVVAGRLTKSGLSVTLLEKNAEIGGRCQSLLLDVMKKCDNAGASGQASIHGTFRFDTGPSLLLFPEIYRKTFRDLGEKIEDHVQIKRVEPAAYRVFFEGKGHLDMLYDVQHMTHQLELVEEGSGAHYLEWLSSSRLALEVSMSAFITRDFESPMDLVGLVASLIPVLPRLNVMELLGQHQGRLAERFQDPRLQAMFTFQDLYVRDSLKSIVESLGVTIRTGRSVTSIMTSGEEGAVKGVTLEDGSIVEADVVISNRDLPLSYGLLRGGTEKYGQERQAHISGLDFSAGVIAFNWCISRPLPGLLHNVFLSKSFHSSWQRAQSADQLQHCPNFYVHVPSRTDPSAAPPGCESVMVLLPVANLQEINASAAEFKTAQPFHDDLSGSSDDGSHPQNACHNELPSPPVSELYAPLVEAGRQAVLRAFSEAGFVEMMITLP
ncbi:hypothetical protein CEUSTIGMA_g10955.t1 [Chlamydomonas eustigma]|uniref:Amine oxidase domain-containing protein n=1 Tax=Chlamydomonas eustigma TaxID=1157962 RepID=A0A250XL75_9CHLO|nr:hypothetical protein CEUSTIGMA_g10955.t1 [Chlamydomonas eustigma]|eukprot:GAX83530.1 hypothetical protein CEUSTIGMA_g10955.t1 [Chlamydomonas eustigma]